MELLRKRVKAGGLISLIQKQNGIALIEKRVGGIKPVGQLVLQLALARIQGVIRRQVDQGKGGKVVVMRPEDDVAFGTVAKFDESVPAVELRDIADIEGMKKALAPYVAGNQNIFYMIKATGEFKTMHVRSCFASQKPYPTLSEVAKDQREFHFANTYGTVIAVWCPRYVNGINLPGWHFHYLSGDKTQGGHILGLSADHLTVKVNQIERFDLTLPRNPEFAQRDLCEDLSAKTAAVEGVKK